MDYPDLLDTFGILNATDKSSLRWDYLRHYEERFAPWRDTEINLLELGVGGGNSLYTWERYFSRATIIGIDINEHRGPDIGGRIITEVGSQDDPVFLDSICRRYPPSIIIDDGSHQAPHIIFSFRYLFPRLAPGGWYVVEDLNITGSMEDVALTPHDYFAHTVQAMMNRRQGSHPEPEFLNEIDCINFAPGIVFIRKCDPNAKAKRLEKLSALVSQTTNPNNFLWLSEVLMDQTSDQIGAIAAAVKATELYKEVAIYHLGLAQVLARAGDLLGAVAAARNAVTAEPGNWLCYLRLGELEAQSGDRVSAALSLQRSLDATSDDGLRGQIEGHRRRILGV